MECLHWSKERVTCPRLGARFEEQGQRPRETWDPPRAAGRRLGAGGAGPDPLVEGFTWVSGPLDPTCLKALDPQ